MSTKLKVGAALIAGVLVSGGYAFGAVSAASSPTIYACKLKAGGFVRLESGPGRCNKKVENPAHWSVTGPQGPPGRAGAAGPPGPAATPKILFVTNGNQHSTFDEDIVRISNVPAGTYLVEAKSVVSTISNYKCDLFAALKSWDSEYFDYQDVPHFSLELMAKVTLTAPGPIEVYCQHTQLDQGWTSDSSSMSVVPVSP